MKEIYLDNSATTRVAPEVALLMGKIYTEDYGNPSSKHEKGVSAERYLKEAREIFTKLLKCSEKELIFTSCGTESDNTALIGVAYARKRIGNHLITTKIEHPAILETMKFLEKQGYEITYLPVDEFGVINLDDLKAAIRPTTILVSIMHTNNEIGSLMPIKEAGALIKKCNPETYFHVDAVQGFGKAKIIPKNMGIDLMSISGHKIHAAKGVGMLYVNEKVKMLPYIIGGGQQRGMRSGTENVAGIAGMALAAKMLYDKLDEDVERLYYLKGILTEELQKIEGIKINSLGGRDSAPHIVSASIKGVRAEVMLHALEERGIYVSSGSACASNKNTASDTLMSIGLPKEYLDATIRYSMSIYTTEEEIRQAAKETADILPELRKYTRR